MMNIGIDIDGTLTEPDFWVAPMNSYFNKNVRYGEVSSYSWLEVYGLNNDEFEKFYRLHGPRMHGEAEIRAGAQAVVNSWSKNFNINYITARQEWLEPVTKEWLKKYELPGEYYVIGSHNKLPLAEELGCKIFIEDNLYVAKQLAAAGINVFLLDCPYNQGDVKDNITRVTSWEQINKKVSKIAGI